MPANNNDRKQFLSTAAGELASLNLTFILLILLIFSALAGAWVPQTSQVSQAEILERFGTDGTELLTAAGLTDVFHSPLFLCLVALLFINLTACTIVTMAPRIKSRMRNDHFLSSQEVESLKLTKMIGDGQSTEQFDSLADYFKQRGFKTIGASGRLIADKGRLGILAAPITHLGLFILLAGVVVSSLTSYSGRIYLQPGESRKISDAHEGKPLIGKIPGWSVKLLSTRRENHPDGKPKQWFSNVEILHGGTGRARGTVSVNNPFTFDSVTFYQSDWSMRAASLKLAGKEIEIPLNEMAGDHMGVFHLLPDLLLIVSVHEANGPAKLFLKPDNNHNPQLIAKLKRGEKHNLGRLSIEYDGTAISSGLQYKYDPGEIIVYAAFMFLFVGALFVTIPSLRIWAAIDEEQRKVLIGCNPGKLSSIAKKEIDGAEKILLEKTTGEVIAVDA